MTHSVQTSVMNLGFDNNSVNNRSRFNPRAMKFYQVDIEDFDNEVYSYEVEARNDEEAALKAEEAALKAEELFNGDIYTMYVYLM